MNDPAPDLARQAGRGAALLRLVERVLRPPSDLAALIAGIIIVLMMLHISADVFFKSLLNYPIEGTLEIVSAYYMVAVVYLPLAYVTRTEGHLVVELFTRNLSVYRLAALEAIVGLVGVAYMALFTWHTTVAAIGSTADNEGWETADDIITVWPSRWVLPVGCGLMAAYLLYSSVIHFRQARAAR